MHKIGIVSYYRNINFGSALQACALQMAIRKFGYDCEHIRRFPRRSRKQKFFALIKNPFIVFRKLVWFYKKIASPKTELRRNNFSRFVHENIQESEIFCTTDDLARTEKNYDAVVCGSDQIWAPNQFNEWFYINFISNKCKKIAYAPSIGLPLIPDDLKDKVASLIKDIGYLSVREKEGAQIVYELTGIDVPVVLDPTLLISKDEWLGKVQKSTAPDEPYILCLFLGENTQHRKSVEEYRQATGRKIVAIPFAKCDYTWGDVVMADAGPLEFIDLVKNASIVFTDSFHGAAFSMNLNKPFYAFMRFAEDHPICQNSRIRNLLNIFGLQSRLIDDGATVTEMDIDIDYATVNEILEKKRAKSLTYLQTSLRDSIVKSKSAGHA